MFKRRVILVVMVLFVISTCLWAFDGDMGVGTEPMTDGSEAYPWLIEDLDDFAVFCGNASYWSNGVYTRLECDLDLSEVSYNHAPIAYGRYYYTNSTFSGIQYKGYFDGNHNVISGLTINGGYNCGLFGYIGSGGSVTNLGLENVTIICSDDYIGGLCGFNDGGAIINCYATGTVKGDDYIGGLCGNNEYGSIRYCYATCNVRSYDDFSAVLCGYNYSGTIINCSASGTVTANDDYTGGLCGINENGIIRYCYAAGEVISYSSYNGGLCGDNNGGSIYDCYSTAKVDGLHNYTGGLCGGNSGSIHDCYATGLVIGGVNTAGFCAYQSGSSAEIRNCFWDTETVGQTVGYHLDSSEPGTIDNVLGLATDLMQLKSTYTEAGWDFVSDDGDRAVWWMPPNSYPSLVQESKVAFTGLNSISLFERQTGIIELDIYSLVNETVNWTISGYEMCEWVTDVSPSSGSSTGTEDITTVRIAIDSYGLDEGWHNLNLLLTDDEGHIITMPISLHFLGYVDLGEFAILSSNWLATGCDNPASACHEADWFIDGVIDELDLMQLSLCWLGDEMIYDTPSHWRDYLADFNDGILPNAKWTYASTNAGRIGVVYGRMRMDCSTNFTYSLNEAILHINLAGQSNIVLEFWQGESGYGDEPHLLPATFSGSYNGDGVAVSSDGVNWTTIFNASDLDVGSAGDTFTIDLDTLGLDYTRTFQIKFQQYDNLPWNTDGREWDNIRVYKVE